MGHTVAAERLRIIMFDNHTYLSLTEKNTIGQCFDRIGKALIEPRQHAGFLFGAGMSVAANLPAGEKLGKSMLNAFFSTGDIDEAIIAKLASKYPLECIASLVAGLPGIKREELKNILSNLYAVDRPPVGADMQAHDDFGALVGLHHISNIFTTNFDKLLEYSIGTRARAVTQDTLKDIEPSDIPIHHLHGLLDDDSYQITEDDLFGRHNEMALNAFKSALFSCDVFVFVGYSMSDPNFRSVYLKSQSEIRQRWQTQRKPVYVVTPIDGAEEFALASKIWDSRNAYLIPMTAGEFFKQLRRHIESRSISEMREKIKEAREINDSQLDALVEKTLEIIPGKEPDALRFLADSVD